MRALELGEIKPVGEEETRRVDVRVIAATNRDLTTEIDARRFREDLFFRVAVVRIQVPTLRGRADDVVLLAHHFAAQLEVPSLPAPIIEELKRRTWRGNVRELRNAIHAYASVGELPPPIADTAGASDAPDEVFGVLADPTLPYAEQKDAVIDRFSRTYLAALMAYANGNQAAAARLANLDRTYLGRMLVKYGLSKKGG